MIDNFKYNIAISINFISFLELLMKKINCKILKKIGNITKDKNIVFNVNNTSYTKNCLVVYLNRPFKKNNYDHFHQNNIQIKVIAKLFGQLGYNVDAIDYRTTKIFLDKQYDAVFDICVREYSVYDNNLKKNAKRIAYFTGSESIFSNNAEISRLKKLEKRRGVQIQTRRQAPVISKKIEQFDGVIFIGNKYNLSTYNDYKLPKTYLVPNTGY